MRLSAVIQRIPHLALDIVLAIQILALLVMSLIDLPSVVHAITITMVCGGLIAAVVVKLVEHGNRRDGR